ncbi:ATP-dependent DNA ligase [Hansschlegelia sp.]|uniref:ATP-dependent DNA ligase n=1 Tax=Hansschlegelia sp. TaxID=2041892 RepID=UPI002B83A7C9|nr:ATP-dependent DNA ligase [Hansschlegelia sp.]HVI28891.1 ATP-dependent DNA ligase [Hansschlegelia sp.]
MAKPPRPPRTIKRSAEPQSEAVASRPLIARRDPRQAELFRTEFIPPCKPTLRLKAPSGSRWQFEIKHDGYRAQCHVNGGQVRIFTKNGFDWAQRMPAIVAALEQLPVSSAVIEGEAVMEGPDGVTDFFALHAALAAKSAPRAFLYAFDLLHLNGDDLRELPLDERRLLLEDMLLYGPNALRFSEHVLDDGPSVYRAACELGLEGIVAKVREATYRSGPSTTWLKIKCTQTGTFVVTGYDPDARSGVRSLKLADLDGVPAGSVGSGLTAASSRDFRRRLDAGELVMVQVEFRGRTPSGGLRHPSLKGVPEH